MNHISTGIRNIIDSIEQTKKMLIGTEYHTLLSSIFVTSVIAKAHWVTAAHKNIK